jgi:DNA-binding SARP family transcriptional activator/tetratricopeptide (TPR) repeat protein
MDTRWRIELLGRLRATQGEHVVSRFRARRTGALLAYLAYYLDRPHPRELLIELFWPEVEPHSGRNNLSRELSWLRRQLEPPGVTAGAVITADRDAVQLNPAACATDVQAFETGLQTAARARSAAERIARLTEAGELYQGELLPGYFEDWIVPQRQRLADLCLRALVQLASDHEEEGDIHGAIQWTRRAMALDALGEETHDKLIRLLAAAGEITAALQQYRFLEQRLAADLGAAPDPVLRDFVLSLPARSRSSGSRRPRATAAGSALSSDQVQTPWVGREAELQILRERWLTAQSGQGQGVFIVGAAGIGKSRLVREFRRRLEPETLTWIEGRCISHGRDIAYLPLIDLLKSFLAMEKTSGEAPTSARLDVEVAALGTELSEHVPFLSYLLGLDAGASPVAKMDPPLRKIRLFEALQAVLIAASARRPLVVEIEDLHWTDSLSEEFLAGLGASIPQHPILLLLTARPGYAPRGGWLTTAAVIDLQSLSEAETAALSRGFLAARSLPDELYALIFRKAGGNPFFVEEVIRSLREAGLIRRSGADYFLTRRVEEVHVPEMVGEVLMDRLARLPEEPKRALQTAAVIGAEFTTRLLERAAELQGGPEEGLEALKAAALIDAHPASSEPAYAFRHALTHDAAYHSLRAARRVELHRLVGAAIEELYQDRLEEQYETLASHYEQGEAWEKARVYLQKSGDKAMAAFVPAQAVSFYDRALAAAEKSDQPLAPEAAMALHYGRGQALLLTNDWLGSETSFLAMRHAARAVGDRTQEGVALHWLAHAARSAFRFTDSLAYAEQARVLAIETDDPTALACSLVVVCAVANTTGDLRRARQTAGEALRAARRSGAPDIHGRALYLAGTLAHLEGKETQAVARFEEGLRISREHQTSVNLLWLLFGKGLALCGRGEYEPALQVLQEGLDLATRLGDRTHRGRILNTIGWVYMELCHWERAMEHNARSAAEVRALGDLRSTHYEVIRNAELNLADCYLALKQWTEARRTLEAVYEASDGGRGWRQEWMKWRYTQHLHASLGELWLALGEPQKAAPCAEACLDIARATDSRRYLVKGRRVLGEALLAQGRRSEAAGELEAALPMAREMGNPPLIVKSLVALGRLRAAQDRAGDAAAAYHQALSIIEGVVAGLTDAGLRRTLLASSQAAELRGAAGSSPHPPSALPAR